jgi:hypothetical protein
MNKSFDLPIVFQKGVLIPNKQENFLGGYKLVDESFDWKEIVSTIQLKSTHFITAVSF